MKKLSEIQMKLKTPKGQYNSFGKYKYRSCEDILEAVKPILDGATLTLSDDIVEVGGRIYVKAVATIKDGEESVSVTAFAREAETKKGMDESQITGMASSYARKYALNGLFLIDDTKDSDTMENLNNDISDVVAKITKCTGLEELRAIWNENKGLQTNVVFKKAVANQKEKIK